jgi:polyphenol oxidase
MNNPFIIDTPPIFREFPELRAGITIRQGKQPAWRDTNFGFRSLHGAISSEEFAAAEKTAMANRKALQSQLLTHDGVITHTHQTHSSIVVEATPEGDIWGSTEADANITSQQNNLLMMLVADCAAILFYDPTAKVVGVVHSGWRGTRANIIARTVTRLQQLGADPSRLRAYISPSICAKHYEVGEEFAAYFDEKYLPRSNSAVHFDNAAALHDQLRQAKVGHIEVDARCTYDSELLHSYRRNGQLSGRCAAYIGLATSPGAL